MNLKLSKWGQSWHEQCFAELAHIYNMIDDIIDDLIPKRISLIVFQANENKESSHASIVAPNL